MSTPFKGLIVNEGRSHEHKIVTEMGPAFEAVIVCKRWRCEYREVNPQGFEAARYRLQKNMRDKFGILVDEPVERTYPVAMWTFVGVMTAAFVVMVVLAAVLT